MKQDRPSFKRYRAHVYRELFGNSLSLKPLTDKSGQRYAVMKTAPYKLFWTICFVVAYIWVLAPGSRFGLLPFLALPVLYILIAPFQYFFVRFVELDADYITDDMYMKAAKSPRPSFRSFLKYVYVPRRERLMLLFEEKGKQRYQIPRMFYPGSMLATALSITTVRIGAIMGIGSCITLLIVSTGVYLLLAPLSLYYWRFKSTEEPNHYIGDVESSTVWYKVITGIVLTVSLVVLVLPIVYMYSGQYKSENIHTDKLTTTEAYDNMLVYSLEQLDNAELIYFNITYEGTDALQSGIPTHFDFVFQDPPGFIPEPNVTLSFYSNIDDNYTKVYFQERQIIQPTLNTALVTDWPEVLAILESELGVTFANVSQISISSVKRSFFRIYNVNECAVEIRNEGETQKYIVNIKAGTARPAA